jgi:hypothetical protein
MQAAFVTDGRTCDGAAKKFFEARHRDSEKFFGFECPCGGGISTASQVDKIEGGPGRPWLQARPALERLVEQVGGQVFPEHVQCPPDTARPR